MPDATVRCPRCQHPSEAGARFCEACAAPLARACARCGRALSPAARFCPECAHPAGAPAEASGASPFSSPDAYTPKHLAERILYSRTALEGERKQVTVLFADLKGSMELLADRDPEEARRLLDAVLALMMEAVHRYEGTVNQVMGDGIMALFGAPVAHEDHAVRACYAALRMQAAVARHSVELRRTQGLEVQIRVGLNSGEVVVRAIGSDLRMDYTAVGQTTHLAARMEQLAAPGSIRITADTLRLAEGYVSVQALGPVPVKGLPAPVEVYEVTGAGPARTRLQVAARRGLTRFVGRDAELEQLHRAAELAGGGRGQVAAIVGEAGAGKSRLVFEFAHSHRLAGWLVLASAAVPYGKASSYLPVIDLLRAYFKVQDRDDPRAVRGKVTGKLLALDRTLEPALPALLALLDVPVDGGAWPALDPAERRRRTLEAVRRLLLREAREQPVLLIVEDLHWVDGETQAVLDSLVEGLGAARLLLLVNYRPEYQHTWATRTSYRPLRLDALPAESAADLLDALLGNDPGLAPLKELLVRRGNPFFLEETVRTLVETKALAGEPGRYRLVQPIQALQTPPTVQVMLAARIDRLAPEDKRLLQTAAVVGKDVPWALLQEIADLPDEALRRGLDHLQAAEFLDETGLYPDLEYSFRHALTHEVAYGGLLQERRRALHARIVEAIEKLHPERLGNEVERLAHHALRGELWDRAVHYLRQAGLKAVARSAPEDARRAFEQALDVLARLPENPAALEQAFEIRLELRPVLHQLGEVPRALEHLREAEALAERLDDDHRRGRVHAFTTTIRSQLGQVAEALDSGTRALAIAERLGDLRLRILSTSFLGQAHFFRGDYGRVVALAMDALAALPAGWVYEHFGNSAPASVWDRCWLVMSLAQLGRFGEAARYEAEALRLAEPTHHAYTIGWAHLPAGTLHPLRGDWATARALIEREIDVLRTGGGVFLLPRAVASSAWVLAQLGEAGAAQDRLREAGELLAHQQASGIVGYHGWDYLSLGWACLRLGRLDEARRLGERVLECVPSQLGCAAWAQHLRGDVAAHPDRLDPEAAEVHYREALALAGPRNMRPLVARCHLGLGTLHARTGRLPEARHHLETASAMYRAMDAPSWLEQAEAALRPLAS